MKSNPKNHPVILLNADYTILSFISLKRAINLYFKKNEDGTRKITIEKTKSKDLIHPKLNFGIPHIVRLNRYKYIPHVKRRIVLKKRYLFMRDNYECQYCFKKLTDKNGTVDHVIPKASKFYPGHNWTNVVLACLPCNNIKGNRTPEEAGMLLSRKPFVPTLSDLSFSENEKLKEEIELLVKKI